MLVTSLQFDTIRKDLVIPKDFSDCILNYSNTAIAKCIQS